MCFVISDINVQKWGNDLKLFIKSINESNDEKQDFGLASLNVNDNKVYDDKNQQINTNTNRNTFVTSSPSVIKSTSEYVTRPSTSIVNRRQLLDQNGGLFDVRPHTLAPLSRSSTPLSFHQQSSDHTDDKQLKSIADKYSRDNMVIMRESVLIMYVFTTHNVIIRCICIYALCTHSA